MQTKHDKQDESPFIWITLVCRNFKRIKGRIKGGQAFLILLLDSRLRGNDGWSRE